MRLLISAFLFILSSFVSASSVDKIVVFGDSLSDNGNLYQYFGHSFPSSPPYFNGRFSDGPVWVETLVESCYEKDSKTHLLDYAFGGAEVNDEPGPSLKNQIALYLNAHQDRANENSLYIIWIGANNYVKLPKEEVDFTVAKVNKGIKAGVESLIEAGAKHIMLVNLPDLGLSPVADEEEYKGKTPEQVRGLLSQYCQKHNELLPQTVSDLNKANERLGVEVLLFDANAEISSIMDEIRKDGNVTQSCYATKIDPKKNIALQLAVKIKLPEAGNEQTCANFLFFDALHPTVRVHRIFAAKAKEFLTGKVEFAS